MGKECSFRVATTVYILLPRGYGNVAFVPLRNSFSPNDFRKQKQGNLR
jgi:hypothetical protein